MYQSVCFVGDFLCVLVKDISCVVWPIVFSFVLLLRLTSNKYCVLSVGPTFVSKIGGDIETLNLLWLLLSFSAIFVCCILACFLPPGETR